MPPGTRFTLPSGIHCSPDSESGEELSCPQSRLPSSALAGLGPVPAGTSNPFPLFRKLSPAPVAFLLLSRASGLHWTFLSCLSTGAVSILPLCPGSVLFPWSRDPRRAPKCYARCPNPPAGKEKTSKTMQHAKEGKFIADSSQGPCCNQSSGAVREPQAPVSTHIYRVLDFKHKQWVVSASRLVKCLRSNFIGQTHFKLLRAWDFPGDSSGGLLGAC